jgi:hypothetical protein
VNARGNRGGIEHVPLGEMIRGKALRVAKDLAQVKLGTFRARPDHSATAEQQQEQQRAEL